VIDAFLRQQYRWCCGATSLIWTRHMWRVAMPLRSRLPYTGSEYFSVSESQVGATTWDSAANHGFSIILDLAIGGQYPDERCGCTTPTSQTSSWGTMQVRSVAVYDS